MPSARTKRYLILRQNELFLKFEALQLSKIPLNSAPYIKNMYNDRVELRNKAIDAKLTEHEWKMSIKNLYKERQCIKGNLLTMKDFWRMLRWYKDLYSDTHPNWESPWVKRQRGKISKYSHLAFERKAKQTFKNRGWDMAYFD